MSRVMQLSLVLILVVTSCMAFPPGASALEPNCTDALAANGAVWRICTPATPLPNGDLVVYAHGYVAPGPVKIPEDQLVLPDGTSISSLFTGMGYYFATTSYPKNGLAVREGLADIRELAQYLTATIHPSHVYLIGASEGGLVTTLAVEQFPADFSGGLALCGPIGDFRRQLNYWGDFRVVFDYFFPGLLPPSPIAIPDSVIDTWETYYAPTVAQAIAGSPHATEQLLRVTGATVDPGNPTSTLKTALGVLWYNAFATNEAIVELGGQPYSNRSRRYVGSDNDVQLNRGVERFRADHSALAEIADHYQTSGHLSAPLVTLHTTADPIVPYWQELLYQSKVVMSGSALFYSHIPINRYGHCNFTTSEALAGFALLVQKANTQ